jgi:transcriptional regulator with XRE-family HTH domain
MFVGQIGRLFGIELRRRRVEAGLSLDALARLVHYSKGHLSKVENAVKGPSEDLARLCDTALGCDGALISLADGDALVAGGGGRARDHPADGNTIEVLVFNLNSPERMSFLMATRRELLATGLLSAAGLGDPADSTAGPLLAGSSPLETFSSWFHQLRTLGQQIDARLMIPILTAHAHSLSLLAGRYSGSDRARALALVADYAEFTGWMAQEAGDDAGSLWWTDQAVRYAGAAGNEGMAGYAMVRRALIAMYRGDASETVELAQQAQRRDSRPRVRGLGAQREAQGHALAHRRDDCLRALDTARKLLAADPPRRQEPVIGCTHVADLAQAAAGWSLYDLGDATGAATMLDETVRRTPPHAVRARARFAARRALALAASDQVEEACAVADGVLDDQAVLRSSTIAADLHRLGRVLRRRHTQPAAARMLLRLHEAQT